MSFPISLRSPLPADSPLAKMLADGKLDARDVNALSALVGRPTQVAPQVFQHKLSDEDLQAAGVADAQDRKAILSAVKQALLATSGVDWKGYEPVEVSFVAGPPRSKAKKAATPLELPEVVITAKRAEPKGETVEVYGDPVLFRHEYATVRAALSPADQATLAAMLTAGKLNELDARGFTLLDHLYRLASDPVALPDKAREKELIAEGHKVVPFKGSMDSLRREYLSTLLQHLQDPNAIYQGPFGTCAATMSQYEMVTNHPADYASMAADLVGTDGIGRMPSGTSIERVPDSLIRVNGDAGEGGRPRLSTVIQTAVMEMNSTVAGTYSNVDDRHWRDDTWGKVKEAVLSPNGSGGTQSSDRIETLTDVTGQEYQQTAVSKQPDLAVTTIGSELAGRKKAGETPLCHVGMFFSPSGVHGSHAVGVTEMTEKRVFYRNPWGNCYEKEKEKANLTATFDAERQQSYIETTRNRPGLTRIYEDGTESLDRKTFLNKVHTVYTGQ